MSSPQTLRLAVFDLDGTLLDSGHMIEAAMAEAFSRISLPCPATHDVRRVIGLPLEAAIAWLLPALGASDHAVLGNHYKEAFFTLRADGAVKEELFPGVVETLDALDTEGWLLGIATSKSMRGLSASLESFGLTSRFVTLRTADHGPGKPAPDMLLAAMADAGADATDTIMVGDTTYDIEMARAAHVAPIGVAWGNHAADELTAAGAYAVLDDMTALPTVATSALAGKTLA